MTDRTQQDSPNVHASSTGQAMTGGGWLDVHFEMARPEYEAQLRAVGIRPGWRVLDAAAGSGSFLPWLAELVGQDGALAALDLAPDNAALVERRAAGWGLPCPLEVRVGTVLALPYPDASLDAVWFANTSQYLTDEDLATALTEFRRVVRPGGLVAVKEADGTLNRVLPGPPGLVLRAIAGWAAAGEVQWRGCLRAAELRAWLCGAGLAGVWGRAALIERAAPLDPTTRRYYRDTLTFVAARVTDLDLPAADAALWARLRDPAALDRFLDDPDFYASEGNILAVGTVPLP
ncbi:MAG: class I SAM-dependent methyltransferase [Chloroflexota bacterium]|nr:class I SAM-dependent methyltransferase [Chloroflexota bacterium]